MVATPDTSELIDRHRETLNAALDACRTRAWYSAYRENPRDYGEDAAQAGQDAFDALRGAPFELDQPSVDGQVGPSVGTGGEVSPYGTPLNVGYPRSEPDALVAAALEALPAWRAAGPEARAAVCLEILARLNAETHLFAHAVMHTTGQAFTMAFQAGGANAQDRGLEAVARVYDAQTRLPASASWTKPQGKRPALATSSDYLPVPRGLALVVGCNTFPTWNGYPGLFASLAAGCPVLVKPHPRAVLPLALTVRTARRALAEAGFSPDLVALAVERPGEGLAKALATRDEVRVIDYTGSSAFGEWLQTNAGQAVVHAEKAGVNTVLLDSTDDYRGLLGNLAFSLSLYTGQMCTTPQNLLIPRDGIATEDGRRSPAEFGADLAEAVGKLLGDDRRALALLGAVVNPGVLERLEAAPGLGGEVVLASRSVAHPDFPRAIVRTPAVVAVDGTDPEQRRHAESECFGPVSFLVSTDSTEAAVRMLRDGVRERGAMTVSAYTTSPEVEAAVREACLDAAVSASFNLTGGVFVNQTAAFADLHGTGGNPAANAALVDDAFVTSRFHWVQLRRMA